MSGGGEVSHEFEVHFGAAVYLLGWIQRNLDPAPPLSMGGVVDSIHVAVDELAGLAPCLMQGAKRVRGVETTSGTRKNECG